MTAVNIAMNVVPADGQVQIGPVQAPAVVDSIRVIQSDANNYGTFQRLDVNAAGTDAMVIKTLIDNFAPPQVWKFLNQTFLFRVQSIYVGALLEAPNPALEAQPNPVPVQFSLTRFDPLLTKAFHDPSILGARDDLLATTTRFKTSSQGMETLVIKYKHTKAGVVWCVAFLALASVAVGLLVGFLTKRAELGVAVSSGALALLSVIEGVLFWRSR